jgi:hypothetical protein
MNRKIILISVLTLLLLTVTVAPVLADSPKKIPATARTYNQSNDETNEREVITNGGIDHSWNVIRTGMVDLTIDGQPKITGNLYEVADQVLNTKTGEIVVHFSPCIWSFSGGSFEGVKQAHFRIDPDGNVIFTQHLVFHGTGIFEGYTLIMERPLTGGYVGYLLEP